VWEIPQQWPSAVERYDTVFQRRGGVAGISKESLVLKKAHSRRLTAQSLVERVKRERSLEEIVEGLDAGRPWQVDLEWRARRAISLVYEGTGRRVEMFSVIADAASRKERN